MKEPSNVIGQSFFPFVSCQKDSYLWNIKAYCNQRTFAVYTLCVKKHRKVRRIMNNRDHSTKPGEFQTTLLRMSCDYY